MAASAAPRGINLDLITSILRNLLYSPSSASNTSLVQPNDLRDMPRTFYDSLRRGGGGNQEVLLNVLIRLLSEMKQQHQQQNGQMLGNEGPLVEMANSNSFRRDQSDYESIRSGDQPPERFDPRRGYFQRRLRRASADSIMDPHSLSRANSIIRPNPIYPDLDGKNS